MEHRKLRRAAAWVLALLLALGALSAASAHGEETKVVRVGWYDSSFNYRDQFGRRCGIDFEYQHKIATYTGWVYEYVEDSWPNLLQMLMDGKIDLLSDVSYKEERTEFMLYPDLPMGTEMYYIYISAKNREITAENLSSFNGKRIGVNAGSVQEGFLEEWAEKNGLDIEIVPLTSSEDDSMTKVLRGTLDGFASIYSLSSEQDVIPVVRVGGSDYYYAVNINRPDLLAELNVALSGIHDEDPFYSERISDQRLSETGTLATLTSAQTDWIADHGPVRIGYLDDYMPFCGTDRKTGELTGALKDFLTHADNHLRNTQARYEAKPYATTAAALEALKAGEVDCVFPVFLTYYDADEWGVRLTNAAMKTGMNSVLRNSADLTVSRDSTMSFAVPVGRVNIETFIMEQYPRSRRLTFPDEKACWEAVAAGTADSLLISNYRTPAAQGQLKKYNLYSVPTGEHIPCSFAVRMEDRDLYFLLNKLVLLTPGGEMDSALASYMHSGSQMTLMQFLEGNWMYVVGVLTALFAVIIVLLLQRLKAQRKAHEQQKLLEEAAVAAELKQTITSLIDNMPGMNSTKDAETGVYLACNQAFAEYARQPGPQDVAGRTDTELFDAETARRRAEDDRMALSMDEPYVYFEETTDASGKRRQVKTTKLKYTDSTGRLCILGVSQDMSDTFRIRRGDATTRESYEKAKGAGVIYAHLAQALARGYEELYYIDLNTEQYIEYRIDPESGLLTEVRRGWHFFESCVEEAEEKVWPEDREKVRKALDRKTLVEALDRYGRFLLHYRLERDGSPRYVNMKVNRMQDDERYVVMGITDIHEQVRLSQAATRMKEEQIAYARLSALAGDYLCVYVVVPETGRYREFTATEKYQATFGVPESGTDFFGSTREKVRSIIYPDDLNRFLSAFTQENMLADIRRDGLFTITYRLMIDGKPRYVQLKAAMVEEQDGPRLIVGLSDIDAQVRQEESYVRHLAQARIEANVDALTGVKNRHAYLMAEERMNAQLDGNPDTEFAVVILDVNDLKKINDAEGHNAGDRYLRDACRIICKTFKHSPVFRVGGDEFAVIAQGDDYACIDDLMAKMGEQNSEALRSGGIVIACGMAKREGDDTVAPVFERADQQMYENKTELKNSERG